MEINEEKLREILKEQRHEYEHFMGIVEERILSNVQTIGEQYKDIKETLKKHSDTLDKHSEALSSHTQILGVIMEDLSIVKDDVQILKVELKKKVDYEEFNNLVKRVSRLEAKTHH